MAIEKRVVGKRTSYLVRWRDPSGNQRSKSFDKKSQAERHLTATSHALLSGVYVDPAAGRTTVKDWSVTWMASRANRKPKTVASYESLLKSRVLPRWGDTQLVAVSHARVVGWVAQMRSDGLSASRTRGAFHLLAAMLDDAVNDGRLAPQPTGSTCHGCRQRSGAT